MKRNCVWLCGLILIVMSLTACSEEKEEDKFYIYSWNTELNERLEYVYEEYPEMRDRICYINLNGSEFYQNQLDAALKNPDSEEYPDLFALEAGYLEKYTQGQEMLAVDSLGIGTEDLKQMYAYTLEAAENSDSGKIQALSWQVCPGAFVYRRSLAEKYLGTDDPVEVQKRLSDWNTFLRTAEKIKQESGGMTRVVSSIDDISNVFWSNKTSSYVDDSQHLNVDAKLYELFHVSKVLREENLTSGAQLWSDEWMTGGVGDSVFGYFGSTWFIRWILRSNCGGESTGEGTYGDWAVCQGPSPYYWGGTWVGASKYCSDREFAGKVLKALTCDEKTLHKMYDGTKEYMNNREVMRQIQEEGEGKDDFLAGQDFVEVFGPMAEQVDVSFMSPYDLRLNELLLTQVHDYAEGDIDMAEALRRFRESVKKVYPEIVIE